MAILYIDDKPYEFTEGRNLLQTCLSLGFDIPYFCWHPAMHSVGACRQCAVKLFKDENDAAGTIVMSCMTPAKNGMRLSIDDKETREFRASVIGLLMVNHPHDCPVCDEGGECHLQDMTVMTGHTYRDYRFKKRTHRNQDLGPFVNHEMNRCIACYRCIRFYTDRAGGKDLGVFGRGDAVYFGRSKDGPLQSEFSGNLIEICPTGVFTDKTLKKQYTRKWDLQTAPSVCMHCSVGCNIIAGERYGTLRRVLNRYNHDVNGYFLCDRGRFGYEYVNSAGRVKNPLIRRKRGGELAPVSKAEVLAAIVEVLKNARGVVGIGSPRASMESNFALLTLCGEKTFHQGISRGRGNVAESIMAIIKSGPAPVATLREASEADAIFILGEDILNTAPMLAFMVRQANYNAHVAGAASAGIDPWNDAAIRISMEKTLAPLFIASTCPGKLDECAISTVVGIAEDIARLGFAVAHALDKSAPAPENLGPQTARSATDIASALSKAKRPLIISGAGCNSISVIEAAANVARALSKTAVGTRIVLTMPECNSAGSALLGGKAIESAMEALSAGEADTLLILENDIHRRCDEFVIDALFDKAKNVIVLDSLQNATTRRADIVLPAAAFPEVTGTVVNYEGRAQRFFKVYEPPGDIQGSSSWLRDIMIALGRAEASLNNEDAMINALCGRFPELEGMKTAAPSSEFRIGGQKVARKSFGYSGRTAIDAAKRVAEKSTTIDDDTALSYSMEGAQSQMPSSLIPRYWAPRWNSVQALNKYQTETGGALKGGECGVRLFSTPPDRDSGYVTHIPMSFTAHPEAFLVIPLYHIFGSEELSVAAPSIREVCTAPYVLLNTEDALAMEVGPGDVVEVSNEARAYLFNVNIAEWLTRGTAGLPAGFNATRSIDLPQLLWIRKDGHG